MSQVNFADVVNCGALSDNAMSQALKSLAMRSAARSTASKSDSKSDKRKRKSAKSAKASVSAQTYVQTRAQHREQYYSKRKIAHHANTAQFSVKRPGVIATIIDVLRAASEQRPVTKEQVLDKLCKRFTERPREHMKATVSMQVKSGLRIEKQLEVSENEKGFWLTQEAIDKSKASVSTAPSTN